MMEEERGRERPKESITAQYIGFTGETRWDEMKRDV
jgi:hypothetical protein